MSDIDEKVKQIILSKIYDPSRLEPHAKLLDEVGLDSLEMVEILIELQDSFNLQGEDDIDVHTFATMQQIIDYIKQHKTA